MSDSPQADLSRCADEPIRVPGAVQPHGRMLVWHAQTLDDIAYSENWPDEAARRLAQATLMNRASGLSGDDGPASLGLVEVEGTWFQGSAHRAGELVIAELEAAAHDKGSQAPIYSLARHFLPLLEHSNSLESVCALAVAELKRLSGFGRCLLYRFDEEGHGEVLAEALDEGYQSYARHHFPASDIPAQARVLYLLNRIRLIPDAHYTPVALCCVHPQWSPKSIDLSYASLRSVSPVHLEFMRNMGTLASMSVSIVVRGKLWGLVSCHDHAPRHLPFETRAACEHLGRLLSLQIEAKEDNAEVAQRLELRMLMLEIVSHLADSDASLQRVIDAPTPLMRLAGAAGAAVVFNDECWAVGNTPSPGQLQALSTWIAAQGESIFHTDRLPELFEPAHAYEHVATGVLAVSISEVHRHQIIWFRPEVVKTVQWAGEPRKEIQEGTGRIHPRHSFASWREQVRGLSRPWLQSQIGGVAELREALIGIVLRRAQEMAEVALELGRVNKELEAFSYTVSHDLRAPMRHIAGYTDLVLEMDGRQISERGHRYLAHVKEAAAFAGQLVDALLDFSRMGRAMLNQSDVNLDLLVKDLIKEFDQQEPGRVIEWEFGAPLPQVVADPFLLQIVVRNLLGNAVKYTRGRDVAHIRVQGVDRSEGRGLEIADNGVGFQMKYVDKLFGVFQRLHQADEFEGTGIGLANVRRIVERHGGTVWARGELDAGATFGFALPLTAPQDQP